MSNTQHLENHNNGQAEEVLHSGVAFIHKHGKALLGSIIAIIAIIGGLIAYWNLYHTPHAEAGFVALSKAEQYFGKDSFQIALNGNGADVKGFLEIIDEYGSTPAGNIARAYAGISCYHLGELENAIKYLEKFDSKDMMVAPSVLGLIGDCYVDLGKTEEALHFFEKAADKADNDILSPIYLEKAGIAYQSLGQNEKALAAYTKIKEKYPTSSLAMEVDKYIQVIHLSSQK